MVLRPKSQGRQRGMVVLFTLVLLLCFLAMTLLGLLFAGSGSSSGMMTVSNNGLRMAGDVGRSIRAVNLADAGVQDTILWLSAQSAPPASAVAFAPSDPSFAVPLWNAATLAGSPPRAVVQYPDSDHTFSVTLYPAVGNAGSAQKSFLIESIGNDAGFKQVLHVYVIQTSFGHYAFWEDGAGGGVFDDMTNSLDGPVHMNNHAGTTTPVALNWHDSGPPIFSYNGPDAFTVGFQIPYQHNGASVSGPPASSNIGGWGSLSAAGPSSIRDQQNNIDMPGLAQQSLQKNAALGTLSAAPTGAIGPTVCPGGGIYIHGDVQQMTLSVSPTNRATQVVELYQIDSNSGAQTYARITLDAATNQTTVQLGTYDNTGTITLNPPATQPAPTSGLTNGVVFCDGNIGQSTGTRPAGQAFWTPSGTSGGLKGVIADNTVNASSQITHLNALTIATDPTKNMNIDGNILVNTQRQIQQDASGNYEFHNSAGQIVTSASTATPAGCLPQYVPEASDTGQFLIRAGRLGLVSNYIAQVITSYDSTGTMAQAPMDGMEIDAADFAYDTCSDLSPASNNPGRPTLLMGSDVHKNPESNHGWNNYIQDCYDARLSDSPPPFYPTTSNRYTLISWQRVGGTVEGTP